MAISMKELNLEQGMPTVDTALRWLEAELHAARKMGRPGLKLIHGIGRNMHEAPEVPNYGKPGHGPRLLRGMTLAVEPMVNAGTAAIKQMSDGWTVKTADGKYAAHYENTILITAGDPELLTDPAESLV